MEVYGNLERGGQYLSELAGMLQAEYGLVPTAIEPAKRGFYGETWIVYTQDSRLFMKIDYSGYHKGIYKSSLPVVEHLCAHGIAHVSRVIHTRDGALSVAFQGGVAAVFAYFEGVNTEDYCVTRLAAALAPIYQVPVEGLEIEKEDFSICCAGEVFAYIEKLKRLDTPVYRDLSRTYERMRPVLDRRLQRLEQFAQACRSKAQNYFITHGDAGGNAILLGDSFKIIDWDHPKLAPVERDAWFYVDRPKELRLFEAVLKEHGVDCGFSPERLGFYSYYSFFYYMMENFLCLFSWDDADTQETCAKKMMDFFEGWTASPLKAADEL